MRFDTKQILRVVTGEASDDELRELGADNVRAIKADHDGSFVRCFTKRAPKTLDGEQRTVEHLASDETQDRVGDVIDVKGWDLSAFKQNPVLLWSHNSDMPPIGRVQRASKINDQATNAKGLFTQSRFFDAEKNAFADLVYRMVADGDLPAVSVGFRAKRIDRPKDEEEAKVLGVGPYGVRFREQELLELSVVTVPANSVALARKLDGLADDGVNWAAVKQLQEAVTGEHAYRVFPVKHLEIEDQFAFSASSATSNWEANLSALNNMVTIGTIPGTGTGNNFELRSVTPAPEPKGLFGATLGEVRTLIMGELAQTKREITSEVRALLNAHIKSIDAAKRDERGDTHVPKGDAPSPADQSADERRAANADVYESLLGQLETTDFGSTDEDN